MRTFKQQQAAERKSRKRWLQGLIDTGLPVTVIAQQVRINSRQLYNMCHKHDVTIDRPKGQPSHTEKRIMAGSVSPEAIERALKMKGKRK